MQQREPTAEELSLEGKFLADPRHATSTRRVQKVAWDEQSGEVVAFAVKVHILHSGGLQVLQKKNKPMEAIAVEEARQWIAASGVLNKHLETAGASNIGKRSLEHRIGD